ncbi:MAG: hypothetical protein QNJ33_18395 [Crocosphaera sp.]|nr:hypothetical protein [Crocosphaera sp.]
MKSKSMNQNVTLELVLELAKQLSTVDQIRLVEEISPTIKKKNEHLKKVEKEKRIAEGSYTIDDFNEETQQAIRNIEEKQNLTICKDKNDLYNELEI